MGKISLSNLGYSATDMETYFGSDRIQRFYYEGCGDCGASSIFVGSMIKAAHPEWKVQFWYIDSDSLDKPDTVNHAIIYFDNGNGIKSFIETTIDDPKQALEYYDEKRISGWSFDLWDINNKKIEF